MIIHLADGNTSEHPHCRGHVHDGVLFVTSRYNGYVGGETIAAYPLTSITYWEPQEEA